MYYKVFPFGIYTGVKLSDLPSTYIVFAIEQFELPDELGTELYRIILGRLNVYSREYKSVNSLTKKEHLDLLRDRVINYENF